HEGLRRAEAARHTAGLAQIRTAFSQALGFEIKDDRGEHFFRSSLVQTLFYGAFAAWVIWARGRPTTSPDRFDWRSAVWDLHVPAIGALYEHIATQATLHDLNLVEVLDWARDALNRVDRP